MIIDFISEILEEVFERFFVKTGKIIYNLFNRIKNFSNEKNVKRKIFFGITGMLFWILVFIIFLWLI